MSFVPQHRVGLVTPSANPAFEPELRALLPDGAGVHAARLPAMPGTTLAQRNERYAAAYPDALASFGDLHLDAQAVGLTGPSYALSPSEDEAFQARLSTEAGRPVVLPSRAIAHALAAAGLRRVIVLSPYPGWLTDRAAAYWQAEGLAVESVVKMSEEFRAYEMTPGEVLDALRGIQAGPGCAVVISGTGMATLDAVAAHQPECPALLLPSNLAIAWALHRALGLPASPVLRRLSPRLAETLPATPSPRSA